jgi:hypothetical protein
MEPETVEQGISNIEVSVIYFCCSAVPRSAVRYSIMTLIARPSGGIADVGYRNSQGLCPRCGG